MMKKFIESILRSGTGTLSSKRLCGVTGFIVTLVMFVYFTITGKETPEMTDPLLVSITTLLGVDSVADIFKHKPKKNTEDKDYEKD